MTLIVSPLYFASKAALKTNLDSNTAVVGFPGLHGNTEKFPNDLPVGFSDVVTNHPKRNKFAKIEKRADGWKVS